MTTLTMAAIGDKLKKAREAKSLTIDQVQKATRIHSTVLVALEEGRCDKMLTPTYVKSFLKKYAEHVSLDAGEVMAGYLEAHPELRSQENTAPKPQEGGRKASFDGAALARKAAPVLLAAAVFFVVVAVGAGFVRSLAERGRARAAVAAKGRTVKAKKAAPEKAAAARPAAPAKEAERPSPAASQPMETRQQPARSEPLNLVLKAKRDVFVMANIDGEVSFKRHLPKGTVETMKADRSINLYIARGESVELILNGKTLGPYGRGVIKDLEITRKGARVK